MNPLIQDIEGKRLVLVDDSIVRGNTTKEIVKMLRDAGAKEVHMRISSPPDMYPCFYGIDTAIRKELIASSRKVDEIRRFIGADTLHYLSMDNLVKATRKPKEDFCTACFDGEYPIPVPDDMIMTKCRLEDGKVVAQ